MKIGYKVIIGSALIFFVSKPAHSVLARYKVFKEKQQIETTALLHSFKTRPENFFKNPSYESTVKSFLEKNIKNIEVDLNAKEEPLAIAPVEASTETAVKNEVTTEQSVDTNIDKDTANELAEAEKIKTEEMKKQKELDDLKELEKQKDIEKAKRLAKEQELQKQKELEKKKAQELAKGKIEEFQYFVQLGVFSSAENANILAKQAGAGFIVVKSTVNDKQYVVRSRPGKKADMEALSTRVRNLGLTPIVRVW